jgi:thiamine-phosphate pyrophosphorylase
MTLPRLQAIVDVDLAARRGWTPLDLSRAYLEGGARFLQIRAKTMASGPFLDVCDSIVAVSHDAGAMVIVNDRVDLAMLSKADGAHVGQEDLPVLHTRRLLGPDAVIGCSTHSVEQVRASLAVPATYTAVGPVFGTRSKDTGYDAVGLTLVEKARGLCGERPVVAIGGITLDTAARVIAAGAACVAIISDLLVDGNPAARVREYVRQLR